VLASYELERQGHSKAMIDLADTFGALLMPTNRLKAALRDAFFSAVRIVPGIKNYVLQMRFKPMPSYRNGVVVDVGDSDALGKMLIQPDVQDESGQRRKLDDVLGPWFAVIGWQIDPQSVLSPTDRAFWADLGARFVQIRRSRSAVAPAQRPGAAAAASVVVEDIDNHFADWMAAHPGAMVVVRPDRYIAAQSHPDRLALVTQRFRAYACAQPEGQLKAA
jgi:3-(3-hydroxy-phenyl)propionate hydroxylase